MEADNAQRHEAAQLTGFSIYKIQESVRYSCQVFNPLQCLEIIQQGEFTGEGIKQTPAYHTPLTKEGLAKWRQEFWGKVEQRKLSYFRHESKWVCARLVGDQKCHRGR